MTLAALAPLIGGIGLFLLGMSMMTDGLRIAAGEALRVILDRWTHTGLRAFIAGFTITAIVQSSSAATVAVVGFVNAGLLSLSQAIWVVVGSNVGTTITGWLVALIGIRIDIGLLALPLLGIGMLIKVLMRRYIRRAGAGEALAGFGVFFLGIGVLQSAFVDMAPAIAGAELVTANWTNLALAVGLGIVLTVLTQSSSAAIAIILTSTATGSVPLMLAAGAVIGSSIGTTSTAAFAAINATPAARRVAAAHVVFNLLAAAFVLVAIKPVLFVSGFLSALIDGTGSMAVTLAVFHTLEKCLGVAVFYPFRTRLEGFLGRLFVSPVETMARPHYLDANLLSVPSLAMRGLLLEVASLARASFGLARDAIQTKAAGQGIAWQEKLAQEDALQHLSHEIRLFISRLGSGVLPASIAAALPALIRASQHIDDLVVALREIRMNQAARPAVPGMAWRELEMAVLECLAILPDDEMHTLSPETLEQQAMRVNAAYEKVKAELLASAASGQVAVDSMNRSMILAQAMRRCARQAIKAQRRMAPWTSEFDEDPDWPDTE